MNPINQLSKKIVKICERIEDANDIFGRKFQLVSDQLRSMKEKIEEDKLFESEMSKLRA